MKKITTFFIAAFTFLAVSFSVKANNNPNPIKDLLMEYIVSYNGLGKTTVNDDFLNLFSDDFKSLQAHVKIDGLLSRKSLNKKDLEKDIAKLAENEDMAFDFSLKEVLYELQREKAGTISALVEFQTKVDAKVLDKGTVHVNLVGGQVAGKWKIKQVSMVRVSEEKEVGNCTCNLFGEGSFFLSEVKYPSGLLYTKENPSFRVKTSGDYRVISFFNKEAIWDIKSGAITLDSKVIGKATEVKEATKVIIKELYKDNCLNFIFL